MPEHTTPQSRAVVAQDGRLVHPGRRSGPGLGCKGSPRTMWPDRRIHHEGQVALTGAGPEEVEVAVVSDGHGASVLIFLPAIEDKWRGREPDPCTVATPGE